ncbi:hypothetical protein [Flavobacterium aquatile]|uniref:Uncharacterized protein n=1 Tax=Flavobacterium aquatile LMG 4008 = ATCC 11947 TaxID=1453498 RepID=A0A095SZA7_9FLAO|nr:hypothetical protein [Flavobacterium aquatile]KGD69704.1 hypothetical protein LG45_02800 [Flavobacterium aquatile LMG 4008 = ATCC 11947]OXA67162.1 hypothetical protein B0A61_08090 [Flavobacterium aquatile LMG 4008 = ATCC 11947]GEC77815.1 hypothetical protein FAQ01_06850 [Flavobacterium aquatile]
MITGNTTTKTGNDGILLNLTSFWIFVEGGLGGAMHLLHIPFTGFLIGGFSVITNILIAYFSNNSKQFLKSLSIVLLAKLLISPYSPPGAYVAVFFQGVLASFIFPVFKLNAFSVFLYSLLVMLESAIQKPLMAYLIFGNELWQGITFFITTFFKNNQASQFILKILIVIYFTIYAIWAYLIGIWALSFIKNYTLFKKKYSSALNEVPYKKLAIANINGSTKKIGLFILLFFLLSISLIAVFTNTQSVSLYLIKTCLILILFYKITPELLLFYQKKTQFKKKHIVNKVQELISLMYQNSWRANIISKQYKGLKRIEVFVHLMIWLNVFNNGEET